MDKLERYIPLIEREIEPSVPALSGELAAVPEMLRYSLESGGKRVRPLLCLLFCEAAGGDVDKALPFAAAVESEDLPALMTCADFNDPGMVEEVTYTDYGDREQLLVKMRDDTFDVLTVTIPSQGYFGDGNPVKIGDRDAMMTVDENGCRIEWIDGGNLYSVRADTEERATAVAAELTEAD